MVFGLGANVYGYGNLAGGYQNMTTGLCNIPFANATIGIVPPFFANWQQFITAFQKWLTTYACKIPFTTTCTTFNNPTIAPIVMNFVEKLKVYPTLLNCIYSVIANCGVLPTLFGYGTMTSWTTTNYHQTIPFE
jgi:hypothetical protein